MKDYLLENKRNMDITNPAVLKFSDLVSEKIVSSYDTHLFFTLNDEKKQTLINSIFKKIQSTAKAAFRLNETELRGMITVLWKRNEEKENYELAAILNEIILKFDTLNVATNPHQKLNKPIKVKSKDV